MSRNFEFAEGEWYHCFSRGVDKRTVFESPQDYRRFLELLYLANDTEPFHRSVVNGNRKNIFTMSRTRPLVSVGAFALMPNHYHLLLRADSPKGISTFMQKLGTAYTMYFNVKNDRVGGLFVRPFRARHVADDAYFQHVIHYIHLNPAELFEPGWKKGSVRNLKTLAVQLRKYPYSSMGDYFDRQGPERNILNPEVFDIAVAKDMASIVEDATTYYAESSDIEK